MAAHGHAVAAVRATTPERQLFELLAALLDVPADELLRVLLEHRVDLVQEVVDVLGELLVALGDLGVRLGGGASSISSSRRALPDCDWPPVSRVAMAVLLRLAGAT